MIEIENFEEVKSSRTTDMLIYESSLSLTLLQLAIMLPTKSQHIDWNGKAFEFGFQCREPKLGLDTWIWHLSSRTGTKIILSTVLL